MPELANKKREIFARSRAMGKRLLDCQHDAGYAQSTSSASQLAQQPEVAERIAELRTFEQQSKLMKENERRQILLNGEGSHDQLKVWILLEAVENLNLARSNEQIPAANKALELIGRLVGVLDSNAKSMRDINPNDQSSSNAGKIDTSVLNTAFEAIDDYNRQLNAKTGETSIQLAVYSQNTDGHNGAGEPTEGDRGDIGEDGESLLREVEG